MKSDSFKILNNKNLGLKTAVIFLPVLQAGIIALFYLANKGSALPMPQWNDEGAYYELIKTWLATGQPLGYWGFDGGHAILGTGSAWSPSILFPYALFGMMFGWNYSSAFFANITFVVLAQVIFILLVKPKKKYLIRMLLLQGLSVFVVLYSVTLMSELLRFSLAIILAGMMYKLYFGECGKVFKYVVFPLYLITIIQVYIFFVFAVPLYVFGAFKEGKWWKKALISFGALLIVGGGSYYLLHLISSNYNIYKTENLLKALQSFDIVAVVRSVLFMVKEGLWGLLSCFRTGAGHGMFKWFVPFLFVMIIAPFVVLCIKKWKMKETDCVILSQVSFGTALFLGAFITVYSLEPFTFFRSLGIVVIFSMYLLMMTKTKRLFWGMLVLYGMGMLFVPANMEDFTAERYPGKEIRAEWDSFAKDMEAVIEVSEGADAWNNTVVMFTLEPKALASMPAGSGVNMMLYSDEIPLEAKYLFFSKSKSLRADWLEHDYLAIYQANQALLDNEYAVIFDNPEYIIYRKN